MLDEFYDIISQLREFPGQGKCLRDVICSYKLPDRGVYFFCEESEKSSSNELRIVRVGTHALKVGSKTTLKDRLKSHLGSMKRNGNHRGSIFRLHVGIAIQNRDKSRIPTWGKGSSRPNEVKVNQALFDAERNMEELVSDIIGSMRVYWIETSDIAGPTSVRDIIERESIGLLSKYGVARDPQSSIWLGQYSDKSKIRNSGLWNLDFIGENSSPRLLEIMNQCVKNMKNTMV